MATLSTRALFQSALNQTRDDLKALFTEMNKELAALIVQYTAEDGKIPPDKLDKLQTEAQAIVEKYFFTRRRVIAGEKQAESERLRDLITLAQKQLKRATKQQTFEINNRIRLLSKRLALLDGQSMVIDTIGSDGNPVSPYARLLASNIRGVVRGVLRKHDGLIRSVLERV